MKVECGLLLLLLVCDRTMKMLIFSWECLVMAWMCTEMTEELTDFHGTMRIWDKGFVLILRAFLWGH